MPNEIRILYVDDEPGLLELGKFFLERSGQFSVDTITSAPAALELQNTRRYDAIISDYQMPEMDGIEFLKKIRSSKKSTPFILFTGRGREEVVIQALNEGADFYLQKGGEPTSQFAELSNKIRYAIKRRHAEEALSKSEERYRTLAESYNDLVFVVGRDDRFEYVNSSVSAMFNKSVDQIIGSPHAVPSNSVITRKHKKILERVFERGNPIRFTEFLTLDGCIHWFDYIITPLKDPDGYVQSVLGMARDITDRKMAEAALHESRYMYQQLLERNFGAIAIHKDKKSIS